MLFDYELEERIENSVTEEYEVRCHGSSNRFEVYVSWDDVIGKEETGKPDLEEPLQEIVEEEYDWANAEVKEKKPGYRERDATFIVEHNSAGNLLGDTEDPLADKIND